MLRSGARTALRWAIPLIALFVAGPAAGWLVHALRGDDGQREVSLLLSSWPLLGLGVGLLALAICALVAVPAARVHGPKAGLFSMGLALLWPAWMTGRVEWVLRADPTAGALAMLAVEGLLVGTAALGAFILLARLSLDRSSPLASEPLAQCRKALTTTAGLAGTVAGAAAGIAIAWLVAREDLRGQALLATFAGGIACGVAARLVGTALDQHAPIGSAFVGMVLAAGAAPLIALVTPGAGDLAGALLRGDVPGASLLQPMDWAFGAALGVPTGLAWVGEFEDAAPQPRHA